MRHLKSGRKLGRTSSHRKAMFRNMVTSLMLHGRIRTTEAKAKDLRGVAERILTLGKRIPPSALEGLSGEELATAKAQRLHNIRRARRTIADKEAPAWCSVSTPGATRAAGWIHPRAEGRCSEWRQRPDGHHRAVDHPGADAELADETNELWSVIGRGLLWGVRFRSKVGG